MTSLKWIIDYWRRNLICVISFETKMYLISIYIIYYSLLAILHNPIYKLDDAESIFYIIPLRSIFALLLENIYFLKDFF